MKLDLTSFMFNMNLTKGGGTPSWGTALGQQEDHKYSYPGCENILIGMLNRQISDIVNVHCPLGKGGNKQDEYDYMLAALFDKIYVNDVFIPQASFVLLVVKQLVASDTAKQHIGRKILKYNPRITYKGNAVNQNCIDKIYKTLNLHDDAAWFVSELYVKAQDELHFVVKIVDSNHAAVFNNSNERKDFCLERSEKTLKSDIFVEYDIDFEDINEFVADGFTPYETLVLSGNKKEINFGGKNDKK